MMFSNSGIDCSKVGIKIYSVLFLTILLSKTIFGQSADLRAAFCLDYTAFIPGNYEKQKAYNQCFENAKTLIKEYEERQKKRVEEIRVRQQKQEERRKKQEERRSQREQEARLELERENQEYARRRKEKEIQERKEKERIEKKFEAFDAF